MNKYNTLKLVGIAYEELHRAEELEQKYDRGYIHYSELAHQRWLLSFIRELLKKADDTYRECEEVKVQLLSTENHMIAKYNMKSTSLV